MALNENYRFAGYGLIVALPALLLAAFGAIALREDRVSATLASQTRGQVMVNELRAFGKSLERDSDDSLTPRGFRIELSQLADRKHPLRQQSQKASTEIRPPQKISPSVQLEFDKLIATQTGWEELRAAISKRTRSGISRQAIALWLLSRAREHNATSLGQSWKIHRALVKACPDVETKLGTPIGLLNLLWLIQNPHSELNLDDIVGEIGEQVHAYGARFSKEYLRSIMSAIDSEIASLEVLPSQRKNENLTSEEDWIITLRTARETLRRIMKDSHSRDLESRLIRLAAVELHLDEEEPRALAQFEFQGAPFVGWIGKEKNELIIRLASEVRSELETALQVVGVDQDFSARLTAGPMIIGKPDNGQEILKQSLAPTDRWPGIQAVIKLKDPETYFAAVEQRRWRFGSLILLSLGSVAGGLTALLRALRRQQKLNEQQSNFVASVSHELRTPTASISLLAEELRSGTGNYDDYPQMIHAESQRLSCLVENVLDISKIDRGSRIYEFDACDANKLISSIVDSFQPTAGKNDIQLIFRGPDQETDSDLDVVAIQRAVTNLLDNAIKFSGSGQQVTVSVSTNTSELAIAVQDQGKGIPDEEQDLIFEPFQRLGTEMRRESVGVGLGLALVQHVVAGHKGRVELDSKLGIGSTFRIRLPRRQHES